MKKFVSIISYIISILFLLVYIFLELNYNITLSEFGRLFLLCGSCIFLFIGGFIWSKYKKNNKAMKVNLWIFFILYLILIITLTLFDPMWGRRGFNSFDWTKDVFTHYIKNNLNIVPFTTIISYVKKFNSLYSTGSIMFNLFGNFIAFMPMAFFLPLLFEKQNKFKSFLLSIITIVIGIELTQFLTFTGRCDIDDLILNVSGALVLFKILKIKSVNSIIRNIFLLENNKVEKNPLPKFQ